MRGFFGVLVHYRPANSIVVPAIVPNLHEAATTSLLVEDSEHYGGWRSIVIAMRGPFGVDLRALLFGIMALVVASAGIPLVLLALLALVPNPLIGRAFVWLSDDPIGRLLSSMLIASIGWAVGFYAASERKVLHGCLVPLTYIVGAWLILAAISLFSSP